ncbi:MAG: metal ABC transporter permease [bacterium]
MNLVDYLREPALAWALVYRPLLVGAALVLMSGTLSVLVVLKRLGFVGQGVSHSAFGGIGFAALAGVASSAWLGLRPVEGGLFELGIVLAFCIACALLMAEVSDRRTIRIDTAIGVLLVGAMALGGLLVDASRQWAGAIGQPATGRSWESVLFGSVQVVGDQDVLVAWASALLVLGTLWVVRRPMLFWALDEPAAEAFGVPVRRVRGVLMVLLAVAVVVSMKLAGVVPATALLVLPGAIALQCSARLWHVLGISMLVGVGGLVASMALALQLNLQPGPCLVLVLTVGFFVAWRVRGGNDQA